MSIICHASSDENRQIRNGKAGDQTGKEVCTREWYSKPWSYVLRPKDSKIAEKATQIAVALANSNKVGYDQYQRNTLYNELKNHDFDINSIAPCETDCSAFITACYIAAGVSQLNYTSNAPTTSTMVKAFLATGCFDVLSEPKYLKTDMFLKSGDVLVKPGSHAVMVVKIENPHRMPLSVVKKGMKGNIVKWIQWHLVRKGYLEWNEIDGSFGPKTENAVITFQKSNNLAPDGLVGEKTRTELKH